MQKIGFMGGTFNPIHNGHLLLAEWAYDFLKLDRILVIPAGEPYKKAGSYILEGTERFRMVELATKDISYMEPSDIELRKTGYTYTFETLDSLKEQFPDGEFYFLCGADNLFTIETWKDPQKIFEKCTLVAATRNETSSEEMEAKKKELEEKYGAHIILLPFMNYSVSSTIIRDRIQKEQSIRFLVPEAVRKYIEDKGFYIGERS